jgi:hypothetical protein
MKAFVKAILTPPIEMTYTYLSFVYVYLSFVITPRLGGGIHARRS